MQPTDALYKDCLALIRSCVHKQCSATPALEYDELLSQASLIFCNAALSYDESKGATFKTHLFNQLKRLSENVEHLYGPSLMKGPKQLLFSLDWYHESPDDSQEQEECVKTSSTEYCERLSASEDFPELAMYREVLSEDGKLVYDTIVNEDLAPIPSATVTAGSREFKDKCIMTPVRLWRKRFKDMGWSMERVRSAHSEVRRVIEQWRDATNPVCVRLVRASHSVSRAPLFSV